ncbi:hypothetical protein HAX54_026711 [Datura stramonium]|uniref:Glutathione S-transferase C-terminal domain-containing protein n=1 Tax=Datura stramonium TaxID=4076 RepID=A0ABS8V1N0_DATST|nr:hypothetical protein [Datura stramonium]
MWSLQRMMHQVMRTLGRVICALHHTALISYAYSDQLCIRPQERCVAEVVVVLVSGLSFEEKGASGGESLKGEEQEKAKEEACETLKVLDNVFKDNKKFFVGNKLGMLIWLQI